MITKIRKVLFNKKGGIGQVVVMMIILGAGALIASGVVGPFKGNSATTGLPGAANALVGQINTSIEEAGQ